MGRGNGRAADGNNSGFFPKKSRRAMRMGGYTDWFGLRSEANRCSANLLFLQFLGQFPQLLFGELKLWVLLHRDNVQNNSLEFAV